MSRSCLCHTSWYRHEYEGASERNRRLAAVLKAVGLAAGLKVEFEYPVVGGRIDVVWLWEGGPRFPVRLPLVGFEVESSWRTRKHIKGDLLNLIDLQPALGVIVLAGEGADVEATRQFARSLVSPVRVAPSVSTSPILSGGVGIALDAMQNNDRPRAAAPSPWSAPRNPWRLTQAEKPAECPACHVYSGHRFICPVGGGTGRRSRT